MAAGGGKGVRAGKAFVEVSTHENLNKGLRRAQRRLRAFGQTVSRIGMGMATVGVAAIAGLMGAVRHFAKAGDVIAKMARRTGVGVEALSELMFAASQTGTDVSTLEKGIKRMQRSIYDASLGLSTQVDALTAMGMSYRDLAGLKPEEQFKLLAEKLSQVEDATMKAALAQAIFGRAGTMLLPLMAEGAAGLDAYQREARRLGLTLTAEDAKAAEELTDAMSRVNFVIKKAIFNVGAALVPQLLELADRIVKIVKETGAWIKANGEMIITIAKTAVKVLAVGLALVAIGKILGAVATLFTVAALAAKAFGVALTFLAAHPVMVVLTLVAASIAAIIYIIRRVRGAAKGAGNDADAAIKKAIAAQREADKALKGAGESQAGVNLNLQHTVDLEKQLAEITKRRADRDRTAGERRIFAIREEQAEIRKLVNQLIELEEARPEGPRAERLAQLTARRAVTDTAAAKSILRIQNTEEARRGEERARQLDQIHRDLLNIKLEAGMDKLTAQWEVRYERYTKSMWKKFGEQMKYGKADPIKTFADYVRHVSEGLFRVSGGAVKAIIDETRGTFFAAALPAMAGGSAVADRTAVAAEKTAKNTGILVKRADTGALVFQK